MKNRQWLVYVAILTLVASVLACSAPRQTPAGPQAPPPTVTPYVAPPEPAQSTTEPPPVEPPVEETPGSEEPESTEEAPGTEEAETEEPTAEGPQAPLPTAKPTDTPTTAASEGPLSFEPPTWIHSWEQLEDGQKKVGLLINISGGAPPFTVEHEHTVVGQTSSREYVIEVLKGGCSPMVYNITVTSADGQKTSKDYWIGVEQLPWCP